jgi:hypothetical protein
VLELSYERITPRRRKKVGENWMPDHLLSIYEQTLKHRSSVCTLLGLCLLVLSGGAWLWIRSFTSDQALTPLTVPFESSTSSQFYLASSNRYFIDMTFQALGPLAGAEEDFLTPKAKSIPCDFKVVLTQGGTTLKDEIITSLKPAFRPSNGRVGYQLFYFDTNKSGPYKLSIESLSSFEAYSVTNPTLEVHLNPADWEGRMILRDVSKFVFPPAMILGVVLMIVGPFLKRPRRKGIVSADA